MLALNRHEGESIIIDGVIEVKIVRVTNRIGNPQVRLSIEAPREISVHRKEIQDAIIRERESCGVGDKRITNEHISRIKD